MKDNHIANITTGIEELDKMTGGFQKGELIIIGAQPSIGKTTFALNMASHISFQKRNPTAFFSLEMPTTKLRSLIERNEANVDVPFYVNDTVNISLSDLLSQARKFYSEKQVEIIFIDYLGLISHENQSLQRSEQLSDITHSLKNLAVELQISVILLCQLTNEPDGKAPSMANIGDFGIIEQVSDLVLFLHRSDNKKPGFPTDLIIAKQRNGISSVIKLELTKLSYLPGAEAKSALEKITENYTHFIQGILEKQQMLNVPFPIKVDISKVNVFENIIESATKNIIYIITTASIPNDIEKRYADGRKEGLSIAQYNGESGCFLGEKCLYVGSCSKTDINTRLKKHIGLLNDKGTYSLHLKHWWKDAKIRIYLFKFDDIIPPDNLQSIEDVIWDICKPFLGKKGPRSRRFEKN